MTWLVVKSNMVWGHTTREVLLMAENWLQVCQLKTRPRRKRKFNYTAAYQYILLQIATVHFFPKKKIGIEFKRNNTIWISPEVRMNYFAFGIIPDTDQWNRRLWERVWTRKKIWRNFSLCLSSLVDHDPFLKEAFSQTWWFADSYYIAPCGCTVAMLIAQGLPLVHGLDAWLCCSFHLFIYFLICWHNEPCSTLSFSTPVCERVPTKY